MFDELRRRFEAEIEKVGVSKVAAACGVSRGTVYNWIASGNAPLHRLVVLNEYGLDVYYVLTGQRLGAVSAGEPLSRDENELIAMFRAAPLSVKAAAIGALSAGSKQDAKTVSGSELHVSGGNNRIAGNNYQEVTVKK